VVNFEDKSIDMRWTEFQRNRITGQERGVPWWVNDKVQFYHFCQKHGLPTPKIIQIWKHPEEVILHGIGDSFVLKPSVMHSTKGVMVLRRDAADKEKYFDSLSQRHFTVEEIRDYQNRLYDECKFKGAYQIFVEEKVV